MKKQKDPFWGSCFWGWFKKTKVADKYLVFGEEERLRL